MQGREIQWIVMHLNKLLSEVQWKYTFMKFTTVQVSLFDRSSTQLRVVPTLYSEENKVAWSLGSAVQVMAVQWNSVQYSVGQSSAIQCSAVQ